MKKTKAIIDRFEGDFAVLSAETESHEILKKFIPEQAKEGDVIYITITSEAEETKDREGFAKDLLNEVLKEE